jgi:hypothetical protein
MKRRSALFVVTCLLVASLANAATLAPKPEISSTQISTAQLPFCAADLSGPGFLAPPRNTTSGGLLCGPCSDVVCRGATAGAFCGRIELSMHCDQIDSCSDNTYFCACLKNNF